MEIEGTVIECLAVKSGRSSNGEWQKQEYILQTNSQYPKKICFMVWGEKIEQFAIQKGETVQVSIDLESREYNGRWYTDAKAWKVSRDGFSANEPIQQLDQDVSDGSLESRSAFIKDDIPF